MLDSIELVKNIGKTAIVIDEENNGYRFFKYKGNLIDISEYSLREQMGK
jgi:hypothetical protein